MRWRRQPVQYLQPRLRRINFSVAQNENERNLLATDPDVVLRKTATLAQAYIIGFSATDMLTHLAHACPSNGLDRMADA